MMQSPFTALAAASLLGTRDEDSSTATNSQQQKDHADPVATFLRNIRCYEMSKYIRSKLNVPAHPHGFIEKQVSDSMAYDIKSMSLVKRRDMRSQPISYSPCVGIVGGQRRVRFSKKIDIRRFQVPSGIKEVK